MCFVTGALSDSTSSMNTVGSNQSGMMNMTTGPPVRRANKMSAMQIRYSVKALVFAKRRLRSYISNLACVLGFTVRTGKVDCVYC